MTPEERSRIFALTSGPGRRATLSHDEFLRAFGVADGVVLGLELLGDAVARRDRVDVEYALIVGFTFGFSDDHLQLLLALAYADWHVRHEDVASALDQLRDPSSIDALVHLAEWVPSYLEYDDARALATKAIWALGNLRTDAAITALEHLVDAPDVRIRDQANAQLERLRGA